jgi:hypothetical protein
MIKVTLEKALINLELRLPKTSIGGWNYGKEIPAWRSCFNIIQPMYGATRKLRAISRERDVEKLLDTLTEVKFAVIFSQLGFQVEIEPLANKRESSSNPDLRITRDGFSSIVEVKRFRAPHYFSPGLRLEPFPEELSEKYVLPSFGHPEKDVKKVFHEIQKKYAQAGVGCIIALWNSNDELTPQDVYIAANKFKKQYSDYPRNPIFVLLRGDPFEKFTCIELRDKLSQHREQWVREFREVNPDLVLAKIPTLR